MEQRRLNSIILKCKDGDTEAFRLLVSEYQNMGFSLALKLLCSESDAEDAVQEAFVSVWQNINRYSESKGKFTTWLYKIVYRVCLDRLKHKKITSPLPIDQTVFLTYVSAPDPEQQLMNSQWVAIVKVLVSELSSKQQIVFTLSVLENMETEEIEKITGLSADNIKSDLYVARQKIKKQLTRLGYDK
jgi:RNA polymerase sigma-70 factor, ECF subfamily